VEHGKEVKGNRVIIFFALRKVTQSKYKDMTKKELIDLLDLKINPEELEILNTFDFDLIPNYVEHSKRSFSGMNVILIKSSGKLINLKQKMILLNGKIIHPIMEIEPISIQLARYNAQEDDLIYQYDWYCYKYCFKRDYSKNIYKVYKLKQKDVNYCELKLRELRLDLKNLEDREI
jgi:hypothetical protein